MTKKIAEFFEHALHFLVSHKWSLLIAAFLFIFTLEIFEIVHKHEPLFDPFHWTELFIYIAILLVIGVLIKFLIDLNANLHRTMGILKYRHNVSLRLTEIEDLQALTNELVKIPGTIAPVEESQLFARNLISGELETLAHWSRKGTETISFNQDCRKCLQEKSESKFLFSLCDSVSSESDKQKRPLEYCLPIYYANSLLALIQFKLGTGEKLSQNQVEIFENISSEMALALKASQGREALAELRLAEAALAERHSLSSFLHDNLSQNLAYLSLKLDQVITDEPQILLENGEADFQHMKDAADQSYNLVRNMIETIYPETTPHLLNLIVAFAKKVSQRANIEISVGRSGKELPIVPDVQQTIFYIFQEALSNVEKHAKAQEVKVFINWGKDNLTLTISDDGVGFDPQQIDHSKHFGMEIMQERIEMINGHIDIQSSHSSGTEVTLFVPIVCSEEEANE